MINKDSISREAIIMSNSKTTPDVWEEIFNDLILESEPPVRYIKDAIIITRSGASYRVSPDDYVNIISRAKTAGPENSDIQSCSLSIDFSRIKRDVNRWANKLILDIETEISEEIKNKILDTTDITIEEPIKKIKKISKSKTISKKLTKPKI